MTATDREAWLDWRRGGIGGSDVAGVLGISPWSSPFSVWLDKLGLLGDEPENEAMTAGRWLEAAIAPWFTHETGLVVLGAQTWATHPDVDHHRCTPDGFVVDGCATPAGFDDEGGLPALGTVQIKVTGPGKRWDMVPAHIAAQCQWECHVTGLDRVWVAVLMGRRLDIHELERDELDIEFMAGRVDEFWDRHVVGREPPEVDGSDATTRALVALYPPGEDVTAGEVIEAAPGSDIHDLVAEWIDAKARAAEAKEEVDHRANLVRAEFGTATDLVIGDRLAASWRPQTTRRLDTKALKAAHPDIVREFTVETRSRVLRAHNTKETPTP